MPTLNYIIKGKKNYCNILVRFKHGTRLDLTTSTEIIIDPKKWSSVRQRIKQTAGDHTKDEINFQLGELKEFILDEFNLDHMKGVLIDTNWLKNKIAKHFNRPNGEKELDKVYFLPFIEKHIESSKTRYVKGKNKPISEGTLRRYRTTFNKLRQYEKRYKTKIKFTDLDLTFHEKFHRLCQNEQNISTNTISNYLKTIKA